ncbi:Dimethylmenaquinone methyltransferase [Methanocaldococcus vulcanius M7]|uniref:Dimethylmenaquinone methyltransferase n=1 Tax=Methanocaldococcus vulcanius (strain ATCC 700851 / DSM 12094 / M7) TaxID=579137 RepID=C9RFP8_METVM|nr:RraA family protein [Methanocaldococcus vulcanius]ACX72400.1 Dimethylmenaquinone methyltransferase [Methanocaldococcus vulcanius M7]
MNILKNFSVPNLCDAGAKPLNGIKPILETQKIVFGEAITVKTNYNDWGTLIKAISFARGKIIIAEIVGDKKYETAVWGGLASLNAKIKGVKGVVIDGCVRDLEDIRYIKFPVFAKNFCPNAGKPLNLGEINVPLIISGVKINPGDIVVGDCNGVAIIKKEILGEIIENAKQVKHKEQVIRERLLKCYDLKDILGLK